MTVSWQSVNGVNYFVERSTNLAATPPSTRLAANVLGLAGTTTFTDTNAASLSPLFYRVGVGNRRPGDLVRPLPAFFFLHLSFASLPLGVFALTAVLGLIRPWGSPI